MEEQLKQRISRLELQLTQQQSEEENLEYSDASQTEAALAAGKSRGADSPTITSPSRKPWTSQVSLEEEVLRSQKIEEVWIIAVSFYSSGIFCNCLFFMSTHRVLTL